MRPLLIVLLCLPGPARADEKAEARKHYEKGSSHYDLGEYAEAVTEFKEAYRLSKSPNVLFDLGQAYRKMKQYDQALESYQAYLRLRPKAPNKKQVEDLIAEVQQLIKEAQASSPAETPPPEPPPETPPPEPAPEPQPVAPSAPVPPDEPEADENAGRGLRWAGIGAGAVGVVALGVGIYFGVAARSKADDISAHAEAGGAWDEHFQDLYSDGERDELLSLVGFGVGAAGLITGGILTYLGIRAGEEQPRVGAVPARGGGVVGVGWRF